MSSATRRTLRTNLRTSARVVRPGPPSVALSRERAKAPYTSAEIASYLALADALPTEARRLRAGALLCLGTGAGLVGADVKGVAGIDVVCRSGGVDLPRIEIARLRATWLCCMAEVIGLRAFWTRRASPAPSAWATW